MDPMQKIIAHYANLRFEDLPEEAVCAARNLIVDALACALAGSAAPLNPEIIERHLRWGGAPEATVLVFGGKAPAPTAAWLNAAMIHSNDFDDTEDVTQNHIFVTILPALLAAGESLGRAMPGREVITALAGAADVTLRLNAVVHQSIHPGWLPTTVFGAVSASMAAARALGLDEEGLANAAGFGYAQSHGNRQALLDGTVAKRLQPAFSARAGVHSAVLAQTGATGPRRIVEGADGFIELFGGGEGDPDALTRELGETFHVNRIGMKPYPSCRVSHPHISAALEARERLGAFSAQEVESVEVWATPIGHSMIGQPFQIRENPQVDAQFSAQWTTAFSLLNGLPRIEHFDPDLIVSGAEVIELAQKTRVHIWKEGSLLLVPVRIRVKLKDGREADVTHDKIKGSPEWTMTEVERKEKFFSCAEAAAVRLEPEEVERAFRELTSLEDCADIRPVLALLAASKNPVSA
ncbi:MAG: MmgE/PrpD family protein [Nitrospinae bacterium]|nr:MmgE/PrpD family protein [Nitrospinota bacterium]